MRITAEIVCVHRWEWIGSTYATLPLPENLAVVQSELKSRCARCGLLVEGKKCENDPEPRTVIMRVEREAVMKAKRVVVTFKSLYADEFIAHQIAQIGSMVGVESVEDEDHE